MKRNMIFIFLAIFSLGFSQNTDYYQQHAQYKMNVDVDAKKFTYQGNQEITYTNNSPDQLEVVYFHLYWNAFKKGSMMANRVKKRRGDGDRRLFVDGKSKLVNIPHNEEGGQNIHWIKQNGKSLKFEIQETILKVYLAESIQPHSSTQFTMEWDAVIPKQIRRAGRNNAEGIDMTMTQWYPKIAEYDYDGWATFDYVGREFHAVFSDYDVKINIDKNYIIGASGVLQNPDSVKGYVAKPKIKKGKKGKVTWHWKAKNILDFAWASDRDYIVENFEINDGTKIYFVFQKNEKTAHWEESKPLVKNFFQIMNAKFGEYQYPVYSFIQGGDGGMEYGMCTMISGEGRSLENLVGLMCHEGAHSWFQQMLATNESMRPWMDEGFTSYATSFVMYQLFPPKQNIPHPFINAVGGYIDFTKTGKEEPAVWLGDHHNTGSGYGVASYTKGETYLVELGYIVGEQNLDKILKAYFSTWKMKHPNDRDFLHIAQKVSGMDLKWFHHYWINTTKTIDYGIKKVDYQKDKTLITLTKKGEIPMPIDFSVLTQNNKVVNFQIPTNLTRTWKSKDIFGTFKTLPYWAWTSDEYTFSIPYTKDQLKVLGIDFSQRMADVNPEDNFVEVKSTEKPAEK